MKTATVKALSQERFFLYWKNTFQPAGFFAADIKKYIRNCFLFGAKLEEFKLTSNYSEGKLIDIKEFLAD